MDSPGNILFVEQFVSEEGDSAAVLAPGVDIDGTLATEEVKQDTVIISVRIHDAQLHIQIGDVLGRVLTVLTVGKVNDRLSVGTEVREPVVALGKGHLHLLAAIPVHSPALH